MTDDEEVQMQLLAQEARDWQAEAERLRAEIQGCKLAASILGDDVFNLTEKVIPAVREEREKLAAENERLREDAEMYRYLRSRKVEIRWHSPDGESNCVRAWLYGDRLDAAIKEAMRGEK